MEAKTIVITGASDGIGAASARQLKALGHRVVIVGRSPEKTASPRSWTHPVILPITVVFRMWRALRRS